MKKKHGVMKNKILAFLLAAVMVFAAASASIWPSPALSASAEEPGTPATAPALAEDPGEEATTESSEEATTETAEEITEETTEESSEEPGEEPAGEPAAEPSGEAAAVQTSVALSGEFGLLGMDYLSLSAMTKLSGAPAAIGLAGWDYVTDYTYDLHMTITPDASGTGRTVLVTAPEGFRYVIPGSVPAGITMSYLEAGTSQGRTVLITVADDAAAASVTTSLAVLPAGSTTTVNQVNALTAVGRLVQAAGAHPAHTHTAVYRVGGADVETKTVDMTLKTYKDADIFNWFRYTFNYGPPNNKNFETLSMDPYGVIGGAGPNGKISEWDHYYCLDNTEIHEPYWNLSVKVYLPEGITSANTALTLQNDGDGKGDYVVLDSSFTAAAYYYTADRMLSPLADAASTAAANAALRANLMLRLEAGETVQSGKIYEGSPIEVTYTTASGDHTQTLAPLRILTNTFTDADNYTLALADTSRPLDFPQGYDGSSASASKYISLSTPYGTNPAILNNRHVGGTLTFEMGANYEVYGITAAWISQNNNNRYLPRKACVFPADAAVTYYIGGTAYTDAVRAGDVFSFPAATPGSHVDKVVFTFPTGFELAEVRYCFGLNLRTGVNLPDNEPGQPGLHRSSLKVTLADDSCAAFTGSGNPKIANSAHTQNFNIDMRALQDLLLMQTYGSSPFMSVGQYPFLSGTGTAADHPAAYLAFGYNTFNGANYQDRSGSWMTYHDVAVSFSGAETLSMLNGEIVLPPSILYTNLRFEYTTNLDASARFTDPVSNGDPTGLASGTARTVNLGLRLADGEYLTALTLRADAFKVVVVKYLTQNGIGFWGRDSSAGRIVFKSRTDRELPLNGDAVEDYTVAAGYSFDAWMTSSDASVSEKISTMATSTTTYGVQNVKFKTSVSSPLYASAGFTRPVVAQDADSVPQGDTFTLSVKRGPTGSNLLLLNSEIWLRLEPGFSFEGIASPENIDYEVKEFEGRTWIIIREDPDGSHAAVRNVTYTLKMRALPSTPLDNYYVIDAGFINLTDTMDPAKQGALAPYLYGAMQSGNSGQNFVDAPANHEGKDLNGNGIDDSEEVLVTAVTDQISVSPKLLSGLNIMPGQGGGYAGADAGYLQCFRKDEAAGLTLYAAIGGDPSFALEEYETILNIPTRGAADGMPYNSGAADGVATPEFAMLLRGPASLDTAGLEETITYSETGPGGPWLSAEAVEAGGKWDQVRSVRVYIPELPKLTTAGVRLPLKVAQPFDELPEGDRSYISGAYSYNKSDGLTSGLSNLAAFEVLHYTLTGGYVFQDRDSGDMWNSGDAKWADIEVQLWNTDTPVPAMAASTVTGADGVYKFTGLLSGDYRIRVILPTTAYAFADANVGSVEADKSHVDGDGYGEVFTLGGDKTLMQNAGIQARYALTVEYRLTNANGTLVAPPDRQEQAGPKTGAVSASAQMPAGYHLKQSETASKDYTTSFAAPEATVVFIVEPNIFTVHFDDDWTTLIPHKRVVTYPQTTVGELPAEPERYGYTFGGWWTERNGGGTQYTADTAVPTATGTGGSVTVYAKWTIIYYTVTYAPGDHGAFEADVYTVPYLNQTPELAEAKRDSETNWPMGARGYAFAGWTPNIDPVVHETFTYTATWMPKTYTVRFDANAGTGDMADQTATYDENLMLRENSFSKAGHAFAGWNTVPDGTGEPHADRAEFNPWQRDADLTLYAQWSANDAPVYFMNNYNAEDENHYIPGENANEGKRYGDTLTEEFAAPERAGYTFQGWYTARGGSEQWAFASGRINAEPFILYAHWAEKGGYTVAYDLNGGTGSVADRTDVKWTDSGFVPAGGAVTRDGYTLTGWNVTSDGGRTGVTSGDAYSVLAGGDDTVETVTLQAQWEANRYTVKYDTAGGTPETIEDKTDVLWAQSGLLPETEPTRSGYTFSGWFTAAQDGAEVTAETAYSALAGNDDTVEAVTVYARWQQNPPPSVSSDPEPEPSPEPSPSPSPEPSPSPSPSPEPSPAQSSEPPPPPVIPSSPPPPPPPGNTLVPNEEGGFTEIGDDGTPRGEWSYDEETEEWIYDEYPPLTQTPATGDGSMLVWLALLLVSSLTVAGACLRQKVRGRRER